MLNAYRYACTCVCLFVGLTIRIHFLLPHEQSNINMGQCILECSHYVELNVKTSFVKTGFYHMIV